VGFFSTTLILFNCSDGSHRIIDKTPFKIGSGSDCDLLIQDPLVLEDHCIIQRKFSTFYLLAPDGGTILWNGVFSAGGELTRDTEHTLVIGAHLFALQASSNAQKWLAGLNSTLWYIYDKTQAQKYGPVAYADLSAALDTFPNGGSQTVLLCRGLSKMGFSAPQVKDRLPQALPEVAPEDYYTGPTSHLDSSPIDTEYGEFTCPVCWLRFNRSDTMNIAVHASLRGDPVLGEEHFQRFLATRFNDRGQALDAMNIPAPEMACPHCRRRLPQGFLDLPHFIFSIVGAPSSGKSYYLSVLVNVLQATLFKHFQASFRDADPAANVILNQMKNQLFSAATPQEAFLAKTELEGAMYEMLPRFGRKVPLPKPFIFNISSLSAQSQDMSVVFYDNAGEHFEPTRNSADSPGAQHITAASGIFFLFDPLHNAAFKKRLVGLNDPQVDARRMDQQDIILAETEVRIKSLLGLDSRERIATPLAVVIGKSDTWGHLLGSHPLESPLRPRQLDIDLVGKNSARIRDLLVEICPSIVANAESISSDVMYFAASPLGCSPVEFTDARGVRLIAPDPRHISPQQVEIPTLWVLSKIAPAIVPTCSA
jgi:hypothetical protein